MLTINTNLSSLIAQESMKSSTNKLDQAIERMTTGFKINHAKDNAANYSISTNMTTQLSAYDVAADNVAMGMDMVNTASDIISQMQDKGERLRALATQARNGTYGAQSLSAINSEANAIMAEINRLYSTAEYNSIKLFSENDTVLSTGEFLVDPVTYKSKSYIDKLTSVSDAGGAFTESEYKIEDVEDLVELAKLTNDGVSTAGVTFILADDIDIGAYCDEEIAKGNGGWTPIGMYINLGGTIDFSKSFAGIFDGNGHVIKNIKINKPADGLGLFGSTAPGSEIKNVGIEGGSITISYKDVYYHGGLVGSSGSIINNCYATCDVDAGYWIGGLVGAILDRTCSISNSYATGDIRGRDSVGGLVGLAGTMTNCYATGDVTSLWNNGITGSGGLAGVITEGTVVNCYATGNVVGSCNSGGLAATLDRTTVNNCYATGNVSDDNYDAGGLVGLITNSTCSITNSYALGTATGAVDVNGLVGEVGAGATITNCQSVQADANATTMTAEQIKSASNLEAMGFTESAGWTIENGNPILKSYVAPAPAGGDGTVSLQIGINSDSSCQIGFETSFSYNLSAIGIDIGSEDALNAIDNFINILSEKSTMLGAVQNRLDSALESIQVNIDNLTSSRSTIRDADIAEVSSQYIQQQILQQASATLMATANQSPAIALQLI